MRRDTSSISHLLIQNCGATCGRPGPPDRGRPGKAQLFQGFLQSEFQFSPWIDQLMDGASSAGDPAGATGVSADVSTLQSPQLGTQPSSRSPVPFLLRRRMSLTPFRVCREVLEPSMMDRSAANGFSSFCFYCLGFK